MKKLSRLAIARHDPGPSHRTLIFTVNKFVHAVTLFYTHKQISLRSRCENDRTP